MLQPIENVAKESTTQKLYVLKTNGSTETVSFIRLFGNELPLQALSEVEHGEL